MLNCKTIFSLSFLTIFSIWWPYHFSDAHKSHILHIVRRNIGIFIASPYGSARPLHSAMWHCLWENIVIISISHQNFPAQSAAKYFRKLPISLVSPSLPFTNSFPTIYNRDKYNWSLAAALNMPPNYTLYDQIPFSFARYSKVLVSLNTVNMHHLVSIRRSCTSTFHTFSSFHNN